MIGSETIASYLDRLASNAPTPGGGAAGALHAAQGAALIAMVARFTNGKRFADREAEAAEIATAADSWREQALALADADEAAFQQVIGAYRLPKLTAAEAAQRSLAIQDALIAAATPPRQLIEVAAAVVGLGERLVVFGNPNVVSDIAAAADAARAAAATGRVNIEINLSGITDATAAAPLLDAVGKADRVITAADGLSARVRELIKQ